MNITFILKGNWEILPPLFPRILYIASKGITTNLICTDISPINKTMLEQNGIMVYTTQHNQKLLGHHNKLADWIGFRRGSKKILQGPLSNTNILYVCSADTALALGNLILKYQYIFQSNELYDELPMYRKGIKKYATHARAFIVPEYCRANIVTVWYSLNKLPFVIPNIPYVKSEERNQQISDERAAEAIQLCKNKKIVLYQGHISADRTLNAIAEALRKLQDDNFVLVLMGKDHSGSVAELKETYPNTIHIPFIVPPHHLEITSCAYLAVLSYDRVSLNNIFCAPNKIYEYSCYGVPMIGNDIPGLRNTVEAHGMGICASYEDVSSVVSAIKHIDNNYHTFQANARAFFASNNLEEMLDKVLAEVAS